MSSFASEVFWGFVNPLASDLITDSIESDLNYDFLYGVVNPLASDLITDSIESALS